MEETETEDNRRELIKEITTLRVIELLLSIAWECRARIG